MGITSLGTVVAARLATKSNTVGQTLSTTSVTTVNGGTSSWAQVSASLSADTLVTGVGFYAPASVGAISGYPVSIDIANGGAGSEAVLASAFVPILLYSSGLPEGWGNLSVPQRVAAGQRLAVRLTQLGSWGAGPAVTVYLATVPYANVEGN